MSTVSTQGAKEKGEIPSAEISPARSSLYNHRPNDCGQRHLGVNLPRSLLRQTKRFGRALIHAGAALIAQLSINHG